MSQESEEDDFDEPFDYGLGSLMGSLLYYNQYGNVVFAPSSIYRRTTSSQQPSRRYTTRSAASQTQNVRPTMINANERTRVNDPGGSTQISPILVRIPSQPTRQSGPFMTQPSNARSINLQQDQSSPPSSSSSSSTNRCTICLEDFSSEGEHRVVSLKCGHIFGKSCIQRWLCNHLLCPVCKTTASDLRPIFGFPIGDSDEVKQLREQVKQLQDQINPPQNDEQIATQDTFAFSTTRVETEELIVSVTESARTFDVSPDGVFVVANFEMPYGIQKISLSESFAQGVGSHNHAVRCIQVCPFNNDLIASVSEIDKRLNIYKYTLAVHDHYILDNQCSAFCWESETKIVVGLHDGTLQRINLDIENFEELVPKTNEPILSIFYDTKHYSFFVGTAKGVYAYRNGVKHLARDQMQSFQYDSSSSCFLITSSTNNQTKLQFFKTLFDGAEITSIKIREYIVLLKISVSTFWTAPNNYIVCLFFDETQCITRIFNWGKSDDLSEVRPNYERSLKISDDNSNIVKYGYLKRDDQHVLMLMTKSKLHQYSVKYER